MRVLSEEAIMECDAMIIKTENSAREMFKEIRGSLNSQNYHRLINEFFSESGNE